MLGLGIPGFKEKKKHAHRKFLGMRWSSRPGLRRNNKALLHYLWEFNHPMRALAVIIH